MKNESTKVSPELQRELAQYGLFRHKVVEGTTDKDPFFGVRKEGQDWNTSFGSSVSAIQKAGMKLAIAAPAEEPFDLLITKDFDKAIQSASPKDLRAFLRGIIDKV